MSAVVAFPRQFPPTDVRELRRRLGLSQAEFAYRFHFTPARIRDWEQGRSSPDNAVRAYLLLIDREPELVERTIAGSFTALEPTP